jgi:hypothetical protein
MDSPPFDIGMATNGALSALQSKDSPDSAKYSACKYNK